MRGFVKFFFLQFFFTFSYQSQIFAAAGSLLSLIDHILQTYSANFELLLVFTAMKKRISFYYYFSKAGSRDLTNFNRFEFSMSIAIARIKCHPKIVTVTKLQKSRDTVTHFLM